MSLLGISNLVLLSRHDRGVHASLEVLALALLYDLTTNAVEGSLIISSWRRRSSVILIDTFILLHLLKDFFPKLHKRHLLSSLSPPKNIIKSSVNLNIRSRKRTFKISEPNGSRLVLLNRLAQLLLLWTFKSLLISILRFFPISCKFVIVFGNVSYTVSCL